MARISYSIVCMFSLAVVLKLCVSFCLQDKTHVEPHYVEECVRMGGKCVPKRDCPQGSLAGIKGLCSKTSDLTTECCFSRNEVKLKKRRLDPTIPWQCSAIRGECMEECSQDEYQYRTVDCNACCISRVEDD